MRDHGLFHLEIAAEAATLYVHGPLDSNSCASFVEACSELPSQVRTLRLDFRAVGAMSGEATGVVRFLLAHWRATRGGEFRLCTSHLFATCAPSRVVPPSVATLPAAPMHSEAMTAAFL